MPLGQRAQVAEESVRRDEHPGFPDRLEHDSDCVGRDRSLDLLDIVEPHLAEAPDLRLEQLLPLRLSRRRHRSQHAAVEP